MASKRKLVIASDDEDAEAPDPPKPSTSAAAGATPMEKALLSLLAQHPDGVLVELIGA